MGIPLQIATPTGRYQRMLRRFTFGSKTEKYHTAHNIIGEVDGTEYNRVHGDLWPHEDTRWPKTCTEPDCTYEFRDADQWQLNDNRIVRLQDGTEIVFWSSWGRCAPPGAMIRADWYDEFSQHPSKIDSWLISLPDGGEWITSQKATGGGYWDVQGTPPNITVSPSIWHNSPTGWHGFVRNGELVTA